MSSSMATTKYVKQDAMISVDISAALANAGMIFVLGVVIVAIGSVVSAWTDE